MGSEYIFSFELKSRKTEKSYIESSIRLSKSAPIFNFYFRQSKYNRFRK